MKAGKISRMRRALCITLSAAALVAPSGMSMAWAQDYPTGPVRLFAPSAGGSGDWAARILADGLERELGQRFMVDNRANVLGIQLTAEAAPDGYTLLFYGSGLWMFPILQPDVANYDPVTDLQPISRIAGSPSVLAVHPSLGVDSVEELIALAQGEPGLLSYSAGQVGSANHLAGELFKSMAGVDIVYVPYGGTGPAVTAAVSGETTIVFGTLDVLVPHLESGRLLALTIMSENRSPLAPDLPTTAEVGIPGLEAASNQILWGPAGLPEPIIEQLNAAVVSFLSTPEVYETYLTRGLEAGPSSSEEVVEIMLSEMDRGRALVEEQGITAD